MNQTAFSQATALSLASLIRLGLLVLFSEVQWILLLLLRNWEISQLRKRLNQEYHSLGLAQAATTGQDINQGEVQAAAVNYTAAVKDTAIFCEKDLALKQISFLSDEIKHLTAQLDIERQDYIRRRVQAWGL